jgi:hypothetical protein
MEFKPRNVLKGGMDSKGNIRVEEWDYDTLATLEFGRWMVPFIFGLIVLSALSPLIVLILLFTGHIRARAMYMIAGFISAYVLYDFNHGWLCLRATNIFFDEAAINWFVTANVISLFISLVLMTFGKLIEDRITRPYTEISEYDYDELNESQRVDIANKTGGNLGIAYLFIILLGFIGFVISHEITSDNRGWVNNITTVKDDLEEQRYLEEKIRWNKENYKKNHTPY